MERTALQKGMIHTNFKALVKQGACNLNHMRNSQTSTDDLEHEIQCYISKIASGKAEPEDIAAYEDLMARRARQLRYRPWMDDEDVPESA